MLYMDAVMKAGAEKASERKRVTPKKAYEGRFCNSPIGLTKTTRLDQAQSDFCLLWAFYCPPFTFPVKLLFEFDNCCYLANIFIILIRADDPVNGSLSL